MVGNLTAYRSVAVHAASSWQYMPQPDTQRWSQRRASAGHHQPWWYSSTSAAAVPLGLQYQTSAGQGCTVSAVLPCTTYCSCGTPRGAEGGSVRLVGCCHMCLSVCPSGLLAGWLSVCLLVLPLCSLAFYNGSDWSKPTVISVKGVLYDVTKSNDLYGPGQTPPPNHIQ
jgi:hypothetical protein